MTLARGLRSGNLFSKRDAAVLDAPARSRVSAQAIGYGEDSAESMELEDEFAGRVRQSGVTLSFYGGILPKTRWGRIAAVCALLLVTGSGVAGLVAARSFLLHDGHFVVEGVGSIQIAGNSHLTRPQLLSVFGGDVERNVFAIPLAERRAELESLPWVAHATVMRLLPNQVRVAIVERTPVAFVRQGHEIELVDASGVLLDMATVSDGVERKEPKYSFPVLTGISAGEPLSTRTARMKIYAEFVEALDATGENVSRKLSEVDVSNPEDVRAVFADGANGGDVLVHFGEERFLERYHQYLQHLAEWKTQYPHLASVDMRYERQVVLEMQPGTSAGDAFSGAGRVEGKSESAGIAAKAAAAKSAAAEAGGLHPTHDDKAVVNGAPGDKAAPDAASHITAKNDAAKSPVVKPGTPSPSAAASAAAYTPHLTTAFQVTPKTAAGAKAAGAIKAAGAVKDSGGEAPR